MRQTLDTLTIQTRGPGLTDITRQTQAFIAKSGIADGLLTAFIRHTSASLVIQENADPNVLSDLEAFMRRTVARDANLYDHTTEGADDMPAHIRSALTQTSLAIPVRSGAMMLGTWQALYVWEHRDRGHAREIALHILGD